MRVLIAGCGYVGVALGEKLAREGHAVFGLRRSQAADQQLKAAGIAPLHGDLTAPESLAALPPEFDWVVHCASSSGGGVEEYRRVYVEGLRNLWHWLEAKPPARLIYISSTGVYGQTDGSVVEETSPTEPAAETAKVLVEAENLLLKEAARIRAVVLRVAGIYGPGRGYWLKTFLGGDARMEGDGSRVLNMVHRDDVAGAIAAAFVAPAPGRIYNVVDDEPCTQRALFEWLSRKLKRPLPAAGGVTANSRRGSSNKHVSNRRLKEELGYRFLYPSFREGFRAEIERMS